MNENQLTVVNEFEFDNPLIRKIDSIFDDCIRDCHHKYFHTFDHICEYDLNFSNIGSNETIKLTISDKSVGSYELNKKLTVARQKGFILNQINKFTKKIYGNLSNINICFYLKHRIPMCHRKFLPKTSQNCDYIRTPCNDWRNPFHFACRQSYSYNNPRSDMV